MFVREGRLPVYSRVERLDNCNFGSRTIWEGAIEEGDTFVYDPWRPPGRQFVAEATNLRPVGDSSYDVVLSSHVLEHSANPLRALAEWHRVLRPDGALVLVLPHKETTFDHRRPLTTLEHLAEDYERGTREDDLGHLPEILELHDLTLDPAAGTAAAFAERSRRNVEIRALHHHVFDTMLAVKMVDRAGFEILAVEAALPHDIVVVARRVDVVPDNTSFLLNEARWRRTSPFRLDRALERPEG